MNISRLRSSVAKLQDSRIDIAAAIMAARASNHRTSFGELELSTHPLAKRIIRARRQAGIKEGATT